jgi:D-alanyl-D-alanine carboxypeptidase
LECLLGIITLCLVSPTRAQLQTNKPADDPTLANKVDDYLKSELSSKRIPGMSVCVVRDGKVVFAEGYGFANIELSVPGTQETIYEVPSLTKPFTATAIMMLVEEGKISLEDPLLKYFPEAPETWRKITIRHLLSHTSGF